jgi:ribonuclease BN (tRNA processing enzyme)
VSRQEKTRVVVKGIFTMVDVTFVGSGDAFGTGGRFQTCILLDGSERRVAVDFGASSLVALNKMEIPHNSIDVIVLTHLHGDHYGGVPFLLLDAMLGAKRTTPLVIAGPRGAEKRLAAIGAALFPGMEAMKPKFDLSFVEMDLMTSNPIGEISVTPFPANHTGATNPTTVRVEIGGKIISYTGDGAWTKHMPALGEGADLLISECYAYDKSPPFHLNYPDILEHWDDFGAKRIVLTHMGPAMLAHSDTVPQECAYDGLVISL